MSTETNTEIPNDITHADFSGAFWKLEAQEQRSILRNEACKLGITSIQAEYDGYGDSGNVEDVSFTPAPTADETRAAVQVLESLFTDFIWMFAYGLHPGFENNDGGWGTFEWDLTADKINLSHHDRYVEHDTTEHEGI